ncbi:hypothetical protein QNI19_18835 [Cytophagaceae bacterium DM2B3-1]|uniref:Uncharacterized protein n=1 Tax=Xanthocytophaga flava TaxID=3048013 RepID=A0ABT7CMP8_9BACT|nr:hypothetical protein [Xanthocytophaga flavus]MDJ1473389.1 hypothetical protein [Xanthocytophaga flavus]MDJ1495002.1 hypothetical protein [Xanthocytophaga flavus]
MCRQDDCYTNVSPILLTFQIAQSQFSRLQMELLERGVFLSPED